MNVYLNWGRWVAHCESAECFGAGRVETFQPVMVCVCRDQDVCGHGAVCGTATSLDWPSNPNQIEEMVAGRPRMNRNWLPGETLDTLRQENIDHEIGVN